MKKRRESNTQDGENFARTVEKFLFSKLKGFKKVGDGGKGEKER